MKKAVDHGDREEMIMSMSVLSKCPVFSGEERMRIMKTGGYW